MRFLVGYNALAVPQQAGGLGDVIKNAVGNAMQEVRAELQSKIADLQENRAELAQELQQASSRAERLRLQARIDRLDRQITEMQDGLAKLGDADRTVVTPRPQVQVMTTPAPSFPPFPNRIDPVPIIGTTLGILFVAFPLALTISRYIWKRSTSAPAAALNAEQTRRFDRLEQSVDAIAIEVERISENQRYLTKLLGESKQSAKIGS
jgi:septal ring factor EnvC (AmiA/AmiB activator)